MPENLIHPIRWIPRGAKSLLDVGCNIGALLSHCRTEFPSLEVFGVDVNEGALEQARRNVPGATFHLAPADQLPLPSKSVDCVTCIDVLEHIPASRRAAALEEIHRVLKDGGRSVIRVPHSGLFAWLDCNNFRFRFPTIYRAVVGQGMIDSSYVNVDGGVVWHEHFSEAGLLELCPDDWQMVAKRHGGLFLSPVTVIALWPFYRKNIESHMLRRWLEKIASFDMGLDFGGASYEILMVFQKSA